MNHKDVVRIKTESRAHRRSIARMRRENKLHMARLLKMRTIKRPYQSDQPKRWAHPACSAFRRGNSIPVIPLRSPAISTFGCIRSNGPSKKFRATMSTVDCRQLWPTSIGGRVMLTSRMMAKRRIHNRTSLNGMNGAIWNRFAEAWIFSFRDLMEQRSTLHATFSARLLRHLEGINLERLYRSR